MKTYLMKGVDGREGTAREDGRYGAVIDYEDGRPLPQNVYAATAADLTLKLARMAGQTSMRLAEERAAERQERQPQNHSGAKPAAAAVPVTMDAATRMQRTHELGSPSTSGKAATALVAEELGVSQEELREIVQRDRRERTAGMVEAMFREWGDEHQSEIPNHRANFRMLYDRAFIKAGGKPENITRDMINTSHAELLEAEYYVQPAEVRNELPPEENPATGNSSKRTATSYERRNLTAPRVGAQTTRWTDEALQRAIDGPAAQYDRYMKTDPTFAPAVNQFFAKRQKRAG
jgi:hypothetical protein